MALEFKSGMYVSGAKDVPYRTKLAHSRGLTCPPGTRVSEALQQALGKRAVELAELKAKGKPLLVFDTTCFWQLFVTPRQFKEICTNSGLPPAVASYAFFEAMGGGSIGRLISLSLRPDLSRLVSPNWRKTALAFLKSNGQGKVPSPLTWRPRPSFFPFPWTDLGVPITDRRAKGVPWGILEFCTFPDSKTGCRFTYTQRTDRGVWEYDATLTTLALRNNGIGPDDLRARKQQDSFDPERFRTLFDPMSADNEEYQFSRLADERGLAFCMVEEKWVGFSSKDYQYFTAGQLYYFRLTRIEANNKGTGKYFVIMECYRDPGMDHHLGTWQIDLDSNFIISRFNPDAITRYDPHALAGYGFPEMPK